MGLAAPTTRLHLRFALCTALAVAAAGAAILWFARHEEIARAEKNVGFHTRYVADTILAHDLRATDLSGPARGAERARLDRLFGSQVLVGDALRVKLYARDGTIVYSNDHGLIGGRADDPDELAKVVAGHAVRDITYLNHEGGEGENVKVLEVYVPVRLSGRAAGVFELYQDYRPVDAAVRGAIAPLAAILLLALLALWATLLPLLTRTTRALERNLRARREAEAALETTSEALRQSQKMDAIGRLAGGVAHDFNNLLLAINGYSEFLVDGLDDARLRGYAEEIRRAGDRAATLTQQLLAFGRRQMRQPHALDLNESVRELETMLRRLLEADVRIELDLDPSLAPVEADPGQLAQVLVNLAVNARDAMGRSGTLTISTRNEGDDVVLAVRDTGVGMDDETRGRIFEPFFTTKDVGEGTGLGLATVYGIVAQSGGTIDVESEPGRGATFTVRLPRSARTPIAREPATTDVAETGRSERILLVEDEAHVRALVADMLREQGYHVVAAASPSEALRVDDPWDLLVADIVMPEMNGVELARRLRARRVLFTSGYDGQALVGEDAPFLQKPFTKSDLARKVRELLDATASM